MKNTSAINYEKLYYDEINKYPVLSSEEIHDLFIEMNNSTGERKNEILDKIVKHNLKLPLLIANKYRGLGISFNDLVAEGNLALINAVKEFDYSKSFKFSGFASRRIEYKILKYLTKYSRNNGLTKYIILRLRKYEKAKEELMISFGREATKEELASYLKVPIETIYKYDFYSQDSVSLDDYVKYNDKDSNKTVKDFIEMDKDKSKEEIEDRIVLSELETAINSCGIKPRDIEILKTRYGYYSDDQPLQLEEVAEKFNVSRETVRQAEIKSLKKLRAYFITPRNKQDFYISEDKPSGRLK